MESRCIGRAKDSGKSLLGLSWPHRKDDVSERSQCYCDDLRKDGTCKFCCCKNVRLSIPGLTAEGVIHEIGDYVESQRKDLMSTEDKTITSKRHEFASDHVDCGVDYERDRTTGEVFAVNVPSSDIAFWDAICRNRDSAAQATPAADGENIVREIEKIRQCPFHEAMMICECGHSRPYHKWFRDHHECEKCAGKDDPCTEFRLMATVAATEEEKEMNRIKEIIFDEIITLINQPCADHVARIAEIQDLVTTRICPQCNAKEFLVSGPFGRCNYCGISLTLKSPRTISERILPPPGEYSRTDIPLATPAARWNEQATNEELNERRINALVEETDAD